MSAGRGELLPGHLMTAAERRDLRLLARDLQAQIDRCYDPERLGVLERQLDGVKREQSYDRQVSPKSRRRMPK